MADALISAICGGAGGIVTIGLLHLARTPLRLRRRAAAPLDMSQYRVPPQE